MLVVLPGIRTDETDGLKCPSRTTQLYCKQSGLQSSARTMSETDTVNQADVNDDMNTDLRESSAPMLKSPTIFERLYVIGIANRCHFRHGYRPAGELGLDACGLGGHIL